MRPLFLFPKQLFLELISKTELRSTDQVDCRSRTRIHSSLAIRCDTIHNEAHTLPIALSDAILITIRNARSTVGLLHIDSDILLNAAAYLFCCLRRDVSHETLKGWISIQDTRSHVSGMQTGELEFIQKLCLKHCSKILVSPCLFVSSGQETWIICKDWECKWKQ